MVKYPFSLESCVFPNHFYFSWQQCENCLCKFLCFLNLNGIQQFALRAWDANEECPGLSAGRFKDLSTQVATQKLTKAENDVNFESEDSRFNKSSIFTEHDMDLHIQNPLLPAQLLLVASLYDVMQTIRKLWVRQLRRSS